MWCKPVRLPLGDRERTHVTERERKRVKERDLDDVVCERKYTTEYNYLMIGRMVTDRGLTNVLKSETPRKIKQKN